MVDKNAPVDLENRKRVAKKYLEENPGYILIEFVKGSKSKLSYVPRKHLLVPGTYSFQAVSSDFKSRVSELNSEQSLFFYIKGKALLPKSGKTMNELSKDKGEDNILRIEFAELPMYG